MRRAQTAREACDLDILASFCREMVFDEREAIIFRGFATEQGGYGRA